MTYDIILFEYYWWIWSTTFGGLLPLRMNEWRVAPVSASGSPGIKRGGSGVGGNVGSASNGIQLYEWSY